MRDKSVPSPHTWNNRLGESRVDMPAPLMWSSTARLIRFRIRSRRAVSGDGPGGAGAEEEVEEARRLTVGVEVEAAALALFGLHVARCSGQHLT